MPFTVDELHDFIRLIETHPEWRAELRRLVLTDELLSLPTQITLLTDRVAALVEAQQRTEAQLTALAEAQQRTEARLATLVLTVQTLTTDLGDLKGKSLEAEYRTKGHAYFRRVVRHPHVLTSDEIVAMVENAREHGILSDDDAQDLYAADVIVRGRRPEDGTGVYLVVEVSWGVGPNDVERAVQRATLLARTGVAAIPVVAGARLTAEAGLLARRHQVWQLTDGHTIPPEQGV
jgi:hypothetical protein